MSNITVAETSNFGFNTNQVNATLILTAPTNFIFSSPNTVTVTPSSVNIFNISTSITSSSTFTITLSTNAAAATDNFIISNLQVEAVSSAAAGNILRLGSVALGGSFGVSGGAAARGIGTNYGTLTSVAPPTTSNAGPDQNKCNNGNFTLAGNAPATGTGTWTVFAGAATITTPTSPTSGITAVPVGTSATLRWTITNGACTASFDDVVLTNYALATPSNAGTDINQCSNGTFTLAGNNPVTGSGLWSVIVGTATIVTPTLSTSSVLGVPVSTSATLRWTITNGLCSSSDDVILTNNPNPTPVISGLNSVCANAAGVVYSTPSVGGHTYLWTITGGAITGGALTNSITVTWGAAGPGTLTVAETITATGCAVTTSNYNVTINANPTPAIGGPITVCSNQAGVVYSTAAVGGHSYVWTISGGVITAGAGTNSITVTWGASGTGTLTVAESITASGCVVTTAPYNVTINPLPTPVISGLNSVCANAAGVVYSTTNVGGHSYVWTITGGVITAGAATNSITVTWGAAGAGTLTVAETIIATGCAVTTPNYNVTINANPAPAIGGSTTVCENQAGVVYSTAAVGGHSYVWTISNGSITAGAGTNSITVTWGASGTGTLTVAESITASGCVVTTAPYNVTINPLPTPVISGLNSVCANAAGVVYSTPNVGGHTYVWTIGGGVITGGAGTNSITVTWGAAGPGTLTVAETITATGCAVTTSNYNVTINANPAPVIGGPITVCSNQAGVVYSTPAVGGHTYVWTISGGVITAGAGTNSITVTWGASGTGTLTVAETITSSGCIVTTAPYNVTINPGPTPVISGLNSVCANAPGVVYSTPNVGGHTYVWAIGGGAITGGAGTNSITVTWGAAGAGTLTVAETITLTGCAVTTSNYNVTINANPTPVIGGTITVCSNQAGVGYSTPAVGGNTYVWTISGGVITAGAGTNSITVTWGASGTGTLTVAETITATGCVVTTAPYNVTINPGPTPVISGLNSVCANAPGVVYSTPNVGGHTYVWAIGGGAITGGAGTNSITVTWGAAGAGTLTVAETITLTGCAVTTSNYNVTINANPTPAIGGTITVCSNQAGVGYSTPAVGGNTYVWTISGGVITAGAGTNSITVTWGASGTGTLTVAETITATGCVVTTAPYNVTINPGPTPVISGLNSVCANAPGVVYSTPNVGGHTYVWAIGGGAITGGAGTNSITVTWGAAGAGTLTVAETITLTGCAVTTSNYNVTINANPTPVIGGTITVCSNQAGVGYSTPAVGGHTYVWTIAGGVITAGAGTNSITVTWGASGTGTLTVAETISATGCVVTTAPYNVTIDPGPTPVISGLNTVCANAAGVVYSTPNVGGHTYLWVIGGGAITGGAGTNSITVTWGAAGAGTLTVAETITATGCAVTTPNYNVTINANPTPVIGGTITVCSNQAGVGYSTPAVGGNTYVWTISGGVITAGAGTNSITVTWGASGTGTLTVAETITATGCVVTTAPYNVTINPGPTPVISGLNSVCANAAGVVYSTPNVGGNTYVWTIAGGVITAGAGTNSITVTWGAAGAGTLTVAETITATGCAVTTSNYNVTINANPTPAIGGPITVCSNQAGVVYSTAAVGGHTYVWTIAGGVITAGAGTNSITVTWGAAGAGTLMVAEAITATGCVVTTAPYNVTINPNPTPVISGLNSVCANAAGVVYSTPSVGGHTYLWTITGGAITGGALTNSITVTWGAAGAGTLTVAETITATGCAVTTSNYNVTINANPTPAIGGPITVCSNQAGVVYSTAAVGGHTYVWTIAGGVITAGAGTNSITVTWGASGTGTLTVAESITATGCVVTTAPYNVTINPVPTFTILNNTGGGSGAICSGSQVDITLTSPTPGATMTLQNVNYGVVTGGLYAGGGAFSTGGQIVESPGGLVNPTNAPVTVIYIFSAATVNCSNPVTQQTSVTVNPTAAMTINNTTTSICSGNAVSITLNSATSGAVITLNNVNYGAATGTITAPQTYTPGSVITETLINTTSGPVIVTYSFSVSANGCSTAGPFTATVTVNAVPTVGVLPLSVTICGGQQTNIVLSNPNSVSGGVTYNWTVSLLSGNSIGQSNGSGTSIVQTLTTDNVGGIVRYAIKATGNTGGCVGPPVNVDVTVNPVPTASVNVISTTTLCSGGITNILLQNPNSVSGTTFTWTTSVLSGVVAGQAGGSGTAISQTLTTTSAGGVVRYTITPIANGCSGTAITWDVTVNPVPASSNTVTVTICSNNAFSFNPQLEITNGVVSTFAWSAVYDAGLTGGVANGTGPVNGTLTNVTGGVLNATFTVTPTAPGPGSCVGNPFTITVPVNPKPVGVSLTLPAVCSDVSFSFNSQAEISNGVASNFAWTAVYDPGLTGGAPSGTAALTGTLTNETGSTKNAVFTVTPTSTAGCLGGIFVITVPISTEPKGADATASTICSDGIVNYNLQSNVTGVNGVSSNFSWVAASNINVGGESTSPQSGPVINDVLINVTGVNQTVVYTVTPTGLNGCQGNNFTINAPVKSKPVGSNTVAASVCSAASFSGNPQTNITNGMASTFTWTASYAPGLTGGVGNGSGLVAETLTNLTSGTLNAVYTVTPTSGGCIGGSFTMTVPVNPQPTGVAQNLSAAAIPSSIQLSTAAGSPAAASYTISVNPNGLTQTAGTPSAGPGKTATELQDDVWGNTGSVSITVVYSITPVSAAGCVGNTFTVSVSIRPEPVGAAQTVTRCSDMPVNYNLLNNIALLGNNVGSTFSWVAASNANVGNESTTPKAGPIIDDALNNVTSIDQTVIYTVTPTAVTGCVGNTFQISVIVHPEPVGLTTSAPAICSGSSVNYNLQTNVNGVNGVPSTFSWLAAANANVGGESTSAQTTTIITDILTNVTFNPQTVVYTVLPTGTNGCTGDPFTISATVNPKAVISAGPDLAVCADSPSKQLQGVISYAPNGVVWSGGTGGFSSTSIANPDYFYSNPSEVNTQVTLTLTANDPDGVAGPCTIQSDQMILKINALPVVAFFGLPLGAPPHAAENLPPMTLNANQAGGLFTIGPGTGLGSTFIGPDALDHVVFDPGAATLSVLNPITYTFTDANSCTNSVTHGVIIDQITTIDFKVDKANLNTNNDWETCAEQDTLKLVGFPDVTTGFPPETQFSSFSAYPGQIPPTIVKNGAQYYVQTTGLSSDTYVIRYDYKNSLGAISTKTRNLIIFASPTAGITVSNSCIAAPVIFTDASTLPPTQGPPATPPPSPSITSWQWDFADLSGINIQKNPTHLYAKSGLYDVKLLVTTNQGCKSTTTKQIRVGDVPIVDFAWKAICTNDSTKFRDKTKAGGISTISTYSWDFADPSYPNPITGPSGGLVPVGTDAGNTSGSYKKPNHAYPPGVYNVTLSVSTNDGCQGDSTKQVFILPTKFVQPIATQAYFENFESPGHGWQAQSIDSLKPLDPVSWVLGTPGGSTINSATSGSKAWWTGNHIPVSGDSTYYYPNEKTAVNGPCFDLSLLDRPMIALNYWVDTQKDFDGAVLQYSVDGGDTWVNVGSPLQGINWYSSDLIISNPGMQPVGLGPYGWTGQSGKWLNARSNLDGIPGNRKQVRIRIALGSDATTPPGPVFDGFAFDDVFVGDKSRNVLIEHFTNSSLIASTRADTYLDNLYNAGIALHGISDFYDVRYHVSYPNTDQLNQDNPADPAARALFFGVTQPPFTIMDGRLDASFTGNYLEITPVEVDRRALSDPGFDLALTSSSSGNKITVQLDITALAALNSPLIAQVALVEKNVGTANKVLRKQLFGSDGETINFNWAKADVETVLKTDIEIKVPISNPSQLMLVAYVQDKNTKEIYQSLAVSAPSVTGATITGIGEPASSFRAEEIQLFPNPANGVFKFGLPDNFPSEYTWKIADQRGIDVLSGDFAGAVGGQKSVEVAGLANGVYFVIIGAPEKPSVYRKLVVMNRN